MPRPLDYRQDIADEICDLLKQGKSLSKICASDAYPDRHIVFKWLADNENFQRSYYYAREAYSEARFDDMENIIDEADTPDKIQQARLKIDTMKWMLGKMKPKKYGDKLAIGGADDLPPVQTQSTLDVSGLSLEQLDALQAAFSKKSEA